MLEKRLYVLIRKDLSRSQQAVQAGHAVAEYLLKRPSTQWDNGTLIYLSVCSEQELREWAEKLGDRCVWFLEPDIGNQMTALAVESDGEEFDGLRLL